MSTGVVGRAILLYNSIAYKCYQMPGNYVKIRFEPLFATSSLCHAEARNDQARRVKLELNKICDETAPF